MSRPLIYGEVPPGLVEIPAGSLQISPLVPGSPILDGLAPETYAGLLMRAPANTLERRHEIGLALRALKPGAPVIVLAAKDKGGTRLAKELTGFGLRVSDTPKRHHRICEGTRPDHVVGLDEALAEGGMRHHAGLGFFSQPGLFSWDRVDAGTSALLSVLPTDLAGKVGDFGCGYGLLSKAVLRSPKVKSVTGYDIDRRALAAAHLTITDPRFATVWTDVAAHGAGQSDFDVIVMNPPFHRAGVEDQGLGIAMIEAAANALIRGGCLWLTANRHLPYEAVLQKRFSTGQLIVESDGFKVYRAQK